MFRHHALDTGAGGLRGTGAGLGGREKHRGAPGGGRGAHGCAHPAITGHPATRGAHSPGRTRARRRRRETGPAWCWLFLNWGEGGETASQTGATDPQEQILQASTDCVKCTLLNPGLPSTDLAGFDPHTPSDRQGGAAPCPHAACPLPPRQAAAPLPAPPQAAPPPAGAACHVGSTPWGSGRPTTAACTIGSAKDLEV